MSPFLDSLAERSVVFERAISSCPTTAPSHASIFTSLAPGQHRVRENGQRLQEDLVTLAELFRDQGYATAAVSGVGFLQGVTQGFDHVFVRRPYKPAGRLVNRALKWIDTQPEGQPFFLWLHLFEPHEWENEDFRDRDAFAELLERRGPQGEELLRYVYDHHGTDSTWRFEEEIGWAVDRYDAQILSADQALRRFFGALRNRGLDDDSLWVITADHGEGLGSHGYTGHGKYLYQEQLRVPLIVHSTWRPVEPARVSEMVRLVDLGPTLAAAVGADYDAQPIAVEGTNVLPSLLGETPWRPRATAFSQRRPVVEGQRESQRYWLVGEVAALLGPRYKAIIKSHGEDELYDLSTDPLESNDLFADGPLEPGSRGERIRAAALEMFKATWEDGRQITEETIDPEHIEELRALGYL